VSGSERSPMSQSSPRRPRPLSPHLQIYSPLITMVMSIFHRITGAALYFATLLLAWWLIAAASGATYYNYVAGLMGSPIGLLILMGASWALIHHALGGIRHLIWDTGRGFEIASIRRLAWLSLIGSLSLTVLLWAAIFAKLWGF
jgi:succinate dehydrogenase / fumarate reductase cytochrome b subunit